MADERRARLHASMAGASVEVAVLLGASAIAYATGWSPAAVDATAVRLLRDVAVVAVGEVPHLFTARTEEAARWLPAGHVHPPLCLRGPSGTEALVDAVKQLLGDFRGPIGVDELLPSSACNAKWPGGMQVVEAAGVLGAARLCKTRDELECLRRAQRMNERAMADVKVLAVPGARQSELTGRFLRRSLELGADGWALDPIWQVASEDGIGPATTHGDMAFPLASTDRILRQGDTVWVDSGVLHHGYVSDFGDTWLISSRPRPSPAQREAFDLWHAVLRCCLDAVRPGATGTQLVEAAVNAYGGRRPWPAHFYLAHGIGLDSAEGPLVGTDLGREVDDATVLRAGMVLVFEPETCPSGERPGGPSTYRAEEVVVVTGDGYECLSSAREQLYG